MVVLRFWCCLCAIILEKKLKHDTANWIIFTNGPNQIFRLCYAQQKTHQADELHPSSRSRNESEADSYEHLHRPVYSFMEQTLYKACVNLSLMETK